MIPSAPSRPLWTTERTRFFNSIGTGTVAPARRYSVIRHTEAETQRNQYPCICCRIMRYLQTSQGPEPTEGVDVQCGQLVLL